MLTISSPIDPLNKAFERRAQLVTNHAKTLQDVENKILTYARALLPRIAELYDASVNAHDEMVSRTTAQYNSKSWGSTSFLTKAWAGLKLTFTSGPPGSVPLSQLDPSYDYNDYENTWFYKALELLDESGLAKIYREVHPQQSQGMPNYVPMSIGLTDKGKAYLASLK